MKKLSSILLISLFTTLFSFNAISQTFTEQTGISLAGISSGSAEWGDYDNDGDLDILLTGFTGPSKIYKNNGNNSFSIQSSIILPNVGYSSAAWGDYDNDGDLDILLTGQNTSSIQISKIYRNNGNNSFSEQTAINLTGVYESSVAWGDYDNDGDLDILLTGLTNSNSRVSKIYKNIGNNIFNEQTGIILAGVNDGSVAWGDYDKDGDLDILITGISGSKIYKNNGNNSFSEQIGIGIIDFYNSSVDWGDYDNDGDLDILITGNTSSATYTSKVYQNNGNNSFTEQTTSSLVGVNSGSAKWGDSDNDGDLDILLTGATSSSSSGAVAKIYKNNGNNIFVEQTGISLAGVFNSSVAWGDYDNDGDLDILLTGLGTGNSRISKVYRNDITNTNSSPSAPNGLSTQIVGNFVRFSWNRSSDNTTPSNALNYNIKIGSTANGINLNSPESDTITGFHHIAQRGMIQDTFFYQVLPSLPSCSILYFSVQALDNSFKTSAFSVASSFFSTINIDAGEQDSLIRFDSIQINALSNGCAGATFSWTPTAGLSNPSILNPKASPLQTTMYKVTVSNGTNSYTDSVNVIVKDFRELTNISLAGVFGSSVAWGDYDNDGDLDILLTGGTISKIYKNNGNNTFTEQTGISLPGVSHSSVAWGDYDNDGDLDILLTGLNNITPISKIYQNNGNNTFTEQTGINLTGVYYNSVAWGDYDNDGELDILLTGSINGNYYGAISKIYKNNGNNSFTEQTGISLVGVCFGSVAWGDYDNDGDLDILLTGRTNGSSYFSTIYKNNGNNSFTEQTGISLMGVYFSSVAWGDYDNDGDLDILLTGDSNTGPISKIYKNNGNNSFSVQTGISLLGVSFSAAAWGDYDNDGDLDILLTGQYGQAKSKIYTNNGNNTFTEQTGISLTGVLKGSVAWGDYDNDGDLDILLTGDSYTSAISKIYENHQVKDSLPSTPSNLVFNPLTKCITWPASTDDKTASKSLSYNIAIGTTNSNENLMPSHSFLNNGKRKIAAMGNQQLDTLIYLSGLKYDSVFYCRVQAIDNGFKASAFSPTILIGVPPIGFVTNDTSINCDSSMQLNVFITNGNADSLTYSWSPIAGLSNPNIRNPIATPSATTIYKVIATSPLGYTFTDSIKITVNNPIFNPDFTSLQTSFTAPPFSTQFTNITPNLNDYDFVWDFGDTTTLASNNPNVSHTYNLNGLYSVSLKATLKNSFCFDTIIKTNYISCNGLGIQNTESNLTFSLFPNPNKGDFTLSINGIISSDYEISISSVVGEVIYTEKINNKVSNIQKDIHLNKLAKGIYFLSVVSENGKMVKRVIIQ